MVQRIERRTRFLVAALIAALLGWGGLSGWQFYRHMQLVGLSDRPCSADGHIVTGRFLDDWGQLCGFRADNRRLLASGARPEVVMIGDSLTAAWPEQGQRIVMRGIAGQSSSQILLRFRQDALALNPRVIHILMGTNDLVGLTGPVTLDQYAGNLLDMVELAQARGETVIVGTIPPARSFLWFHLGDPAPDVDRLNARLRQLAKARGLVLADYHAALVHPDGSTRTDLFMDDGIHLTRTGYAAIQPVFDAALAEARARQAAR